MTSTGHPNADQRRPSGGLPSALEGLNVLTFPGVAADFCGYLMAHLGATVRSVEASSPEVDGSEAAHDAGSAPSAFDLAYRSGRETVSARLPEDLTSGALDELLAAADVVVTDTVLAGDREVTYEQLVTLNPTVVHAEISTVGSTGPGSGQPGGDLIATAGSGFLQLTGTPGKSPVRMGADQALKLGGAEAAAGIMISLHHRDRTGRGQHVDVSVRDAMVRATVNAIPKYRYEGTVQDRVGDHWGVRDRPLKALWRCADGWVSFVRRGGVLGGRVNQATVAWMQDHGVDTGDLEQTDWDAMDLGREADRERLDRLDDLFAGFLQGQRTEVVFKEGLGRGITLAPVRTLTDVLGERHFEERQYWAEHSTGSASLRLPRYLVKSSVAPAAAAVGSPPADPQETNQQGMRNEYV